MAFAAVTTVRSTVARLRPYLMTASAFRQPSSTCRATFPAQHLRPSGILRFYPGSNEQHRLFIGVYLKSTCSRDTSASKALGVLNDYALYKSTHSLNRHLFLATACVSEFGPVATCVCVVNDSIVLFCIVYR